MRNINYRVVDLRVKLQCSQGQPGLIDAAHSMYTGGVLADFAVVWYESNLPIFFRVLHWHGTRPFQYHSRKIKRGLEATRFMFGIVLSIRNVLCISAESSSIMIRNYSEVLRLCFAILNFQFCPHVNIGASENQRGHLREYKYRGLGTLY